MAKRGAQTDLNHDNWDDEEEEIERGEFSRASGDRLAGRKIAKAKRRFVTSESSSSTGLFSGFSGFGVPTKSSAQSDTTSKPAHGFTGLSSDREPPISTSTPLVNAIPANDKANKVSNGFGSKTDVGPATKKQKSAADGDDEFRSDLKALNDGVLSWCRTHIEQNPYVDLSPVFRDYFKHMAELDKKYATGGETENKSNYEAINTEKKQSPEPATKTSSVSGFKFGSSNEKNNGDAPPLPATYNFGGIQPSTDSVAATTTAPIVFSFGSTTASAMTTTTAPAVFSLRPTDAVVTTTAADSPVFSFGATNSTSSTSTTASAPKPSLFGPQSTEFTGFPAMSATRPLTFGTSSATSGGPIFGFSSNATTVASSSDSAAATENDDDDKPYEPPKAEVVETEEPDAIYFIKCKLFYMKEGSYVDKGVGTLYLKPLDSGKTQLLIRAGTASGTILLNVVLSAGMPTQRTGKNNVTLVCVPNPPMETASKRKDAKKDDDGEEQDDGEQSTTKPAYLLIRVKTSEDADGLLSKLNEHKS